MNMLAKLVVRLYEKLRKWCYESPVDRLKRGAKIGNNVTISNSTILLHDASIKKN